MKYSNLASHVVVFVHFVLHKANDEFVVLSKWALGDLFILLCIAYSWVSIEFAINHRYAIRFV